MRLLLRRRVAVPVAAAVAAASGMAVVWFGDDPVRRPPPAAGIAGPSSHAAVVPSAFPPTDAPRSPAVPVLPEATTPVAHGATTPAPRQATASARVTTTPPRTTPPRTSPPRPTSPKPKPPDAPAPQGMSMDDLIRNDGSPPEGVANQVNFFLGGGGDCATEPTGKPRVHVPAVVEIPSVPVLCFDGFGWGGKGMTLTFTSPVSTWTVKAGWSDVSGAPLPILPGSPTGRYRVRAEHGSRTATAEFVVRRAEKPRLWVTPRTAHAGDTIDVYLGGFPPGQPSDLHLYATTGLQYRSTMRVAMDAHGEAHLVVRTSPTTEATSYAFNSPLIYVPPPHFEPGEFGGPDNSVLWLYQP